jgi:hypothetical protein
MDLPGTLTRQALAARLESGLPLERPTAGTSMVPFLRAGDRVRIVGVEPRDLRLGDLIAFWRGEDLIVHRFAGWAGPGVFREKGDHQRDCGTGAAADLAGRVDRVYRPGGEQDLTSASARRESRLLGLRAWAFCLLFPTARRCYRGLRRRP